MILIPDIKTIVILTPRTGSGSTYRAVLARYPNAMMLYRHMEADGVPQGYDRWAKVGLVRDPLERLWSLYKFLTSFGGPHCPDYIQSMRESVSRPFSEWILENETPFTTPYDSSGRGRFFPEYTCRHPLPENKKSQYMYLRPDLGTQIYSFSDMDLFVKRLGIRLDHHNKTHPEQCPIISQKAKEHMEHYFEWDMNYIQGLNNA